jgi:hypothetical protein
MRGLVADASSFNGGGGPSLGLDFMTPGVLDPRITFTRASTATYFDSAGVMQTTAVNAPRWDYDPATLALRGLLIEEVRTNLLFPAIPSGAPNWSLSGPVVAAAGSTTLPDGTASTISLMSATDTTNAIRVWSHVLGVPATSSTAYTVSAFVKRSSGAATNAHIQINAGGGATTASAAYYDLGAGTAVVGADFLAGQTSKSVSIVSVGNGWYRIGYTFTISATNNLITAFVGPCTVVSSSGDNRSYVGVVGQGIYAWGVQAEAGAFATSYIPTTSAAVTRAADICNISPLGSWFSTGPGSFLCEFDMTRAGGVPGGFSSGAFANVIYLSQSAGGAATNIASVGVAQGSTIVSTAGIVQKMAVAYGPGRLAVCNNGLAVATNATLAAGPYPWTLNFALGSAPWSVGTNAICGHMRRAAYWSSALPDATLQQLTAL